MIVRDMSEFRTLVQKSYQHYRNRKVRKNKNTVGQADHNKNLHSDVNFQRIAIPSENKFRAVNLIRGKADG